MHQLIQRTFAVSAVFLLGALVACEPPDEAESADGPEATGEITQRSISSGEAIVGLVGKCVDVDRVATTLAGNHPAILKACNGTSSQAWERVAISATKFTLRNRFSGLCLNVEGGGSVNNTPVVEYPCTATPLPNETWRYDEYASGANKGVAQIVSDGSAKCLNVDGAARADGTRLIQYTCFGLPNDRWFWAQNVVKPIKIKPFALANNDGVTHKATITKAQLHAVIDEANYIYRRAGIFLDFQDSYWVDRADTLLNTIDGSATSAQDVAARTLASSNSGFVTVLLRYGSGSSPTGGGFSGYTPTTGDYAVMPGTGFDASLLAHELGHYFSLVHTLDTGLYSATVDYNTMVYNSMSSQGSFDPEVSLNADGLSDTPGDPGPWVFERRYGTTPDPDLPKADWAFHTCEGTDAINITNPSTGAVVSTPQPDRHNMMSYDQCRTQPRDLTVSPLQIAKMRKGLTVVGRSQL